MKTKSGYNYKIILASALFILYYVKGGWMQRCAEKWEKKQAG